ncbi:hypothetical protein GP486_008025 [Trichoglossum hirsutum]|uniref:DNA/RNA-binding protein Alba-like domain-containing protein n=1 Tax=Trichoglossum hirsutum TaxID=265104 RepID=A0A9P8IEF5_9PEZI|nr:hypothetical protein GP486_008025 [Trichoglossum hirsutum]
MARTKKNRPGGARRHKEAAPKRTSDRAAAGARPDGERPAKRARLEKDTSRPRALSKPGNTSNDAVQEPGKRHGKKAGVEEGSNSTSVALTRPEPERNPARPAKQSGVSLLPQSQSPRAAVQAERPNTRASFSSSLSNTHDTISLSVLSSSSIRKKVSKILSHLSSQPTLEKPPIAVLTAKAGVASKAITIAEITKREIGKDDGVWFQYSGVEGVLGGWTPRDRRTESGREKMVESVGDGAKTTVSEKEVAEVTQEKVNRGKEVEDDEQEEEYAFETMRDPPTNSRGMQESPSIAEDELERKVRAVPVLTIYLSRTRVGELKKEYG